jgi:hypothetical protein
MTTDTPGPQIDTSKAHPARVYDWLLGGKDNYRADWEVGERLPEAAKHAARQNREFMHRASAWLARIGIDQFLDIGTGIPTEPNLHQIVQGITPASRVVYTDYDPIVLVHAQALLISSPEGATDYIQSDVRDPRVILEHARRILDFDRPIALSLIALMHFLPDDWQPYEIVNTLVDAMPPGSYLVMSHGSSDLMPEESSRGAKEYVKGGIPLALRDREQVLRFFDHVDLVEPGLVVTMDWFKDTPAPPRERGQMYGAVGRVRTKA